MKVVLFCGGLGLRLRSYTEKVPKPMLTIGDRPILWHLMHWYAAQGHEDFILCLGYLSHVIRDYFTQWPGAHLDPHDVDLVRLPSSESGGTPWTVRLLETGVDSNVGQRLRQAEPYLAAEEMFLANYSDGLTDVRLEQVIDQLRQSTATGTFLAVRPTFAYHLVILDPAGRPTSIDSAEDANLRINGGFFVFRPEIFAEIREGEDLVPEPLRRLMAAGRLLSYAHDGFWAPMDTFKERERLDSLLRGGTAPWEIWKVRRER